MSVTSHRSKDGVRTSKTMSENQRKETSEMLQAPTKKQKIEKHVDDNNKENILPSEKNRSDFNFHSCSVTINYK